MNLFFFSFVFLCSWKIQWLYGTASPITVPCCPQSISSIDFVLSNNVLTLFSSITGWVNLCKDSALRLLCPFSLKQSMRDKNPTQKSWIQHSFSTRWRCQIYLTSFTWYRPEFHIFCRPTAVHLCQGLAVFHSSNIRFTALSTTCNALTK